MTDNTERDLSWGKMRSEEEVKNKITVLEGRLNSDSVDHAYLFGLDVAIRELRWVLGEVDYI